MEPGLEPSPLHAEPSERGWRLPLLIAGLVGLGVLAGIVWLGRPGSEPTPAVPTHLPPLGPAEEAYLPQIELGPPELSRMQNYLGQQVTYLDLSVMNRGPQRVVALEVTIEFLDPYQAVVLRESFRAIAPARPSPAGHPTGPLAAGESRTVRTSFEHIPADWDRRPPRVRITGLMLQ